MERGSDPSSSSIDKTKVLDVKPLRSLAPVFPTAPPHPSGSFPFFPFGPQASHGVNQNTPTSGAIPAPIRSYRRPDGEGLNEGLPVKPKRARKSKSSEKKPKKKSQDPGSDLSSLFGISLAQKEDGDGEVVNVVLIAFDAIRRRLSQLEDAKELSTGLIKRADLKSGNILMTKGIRTNMRKRIGAVPGIEIGDIFFFRMELCVVGLHAPSMGGIDYMTPRGESEEEPQAVSIVSSGGYDDDVDDSDVLIYTGQGGNSNKKDKEVADQKLERGNLALEVSSRRHNEVRVIRGMRDAANPSLKVYVYDGLYKIQESWRERGKSGGGVFKYKLVRMPGQHSAFAVWKSVQKWKEGNPSRNGFILADLSSGAEKFPISLVNDVDYEKGPAHFTYSQSLKHPKSFSLVQTSSTCNCHSACVPGDLNCSCIRRNEGDFPYTGNGILVSRRPLVHECGPACKCFPNCKNRASQTGLKFQMEVFKTNNRGWGLRTLDPIRAGTFVCEYAGEVIDRSKINQNGEGDEYVFDTTRNYSSFKWNYEPRLLEEVSSNDSSEDHTIPSLIISAKKVGNVARFMNHSCTPNVFWQPVLYEENNQSFLHIAFFALRHVPPMTELTYDYGVSRSVHTGSSSTPKGQKKCLCGSSKCRGSFG
ncbi:hypothetical protein L6164_017746 [Bauhinia variegata]|uniref:Uncharacterized protein n=1 Tax=Bauhinia variegata TaxID=167791 RepID=A0ACB9N9I8_BAUVA|nr:hypothetical protein L6164_017746 [Bauhinia variegata]